MNQKGFANIVLIIGIVILAGAVGYFTFIQKSTPPTENQQPPLGDQSVTDQDLLPNDSNQPQQPRIIHRGADFVREEDRPRVLFPQGGEELGVGKTYNIRWENYLSDEPLAIDVFAQKDYGTVYVKKLVGNVPAKESGFYAWTVSEPSYSQYKVQIYADVGDKFLNGASKNFFTISGGEPLIIKPPEPLQTENLIVSTPLGNETVLSPIIVKGKARNIFFEGEFKIELRGYDYPLSDPRYAESSRVVTSTFARLVGECDWMRGEWCDFEAVINYPSSGTGVENSLYFYSGGAGGVSTPGGTVEDMLKFLRGEGGKPGTIAPPQFIAALAIKLK